MKLRVLGFQGGSTPSRHLPGLCLDETVADLSALNGRVRVLPDGEVHVW